MPRTANRHSPGGLYICTVRGKKGKKGKKEREKREKEREKERKREKEELYDIPTITNDQNMLLNS